MSRTRFTAPLREALAPGLFEHPIFAGYAAHRDLLQSIDWPALATLDARLHAHSAGGMPLRFATQDEALLGDGLHYESRIHERALIATRARNWHDLLNALVWMQHAPIKRALNLRQVHEIAVVGPRTRSRAQCALTHFDEAGAVVWLDDAQRAAAWDAHDWPAWFGQREAFARGAIRVHVFGHALLEHALWPQRLPTAKCLVLHGGDPAQWQAELADAISRGALLADPQELRPLPLAGLPGWAPGQDHAVFFAQDAFRPLRAGRRYPAPWRMRDRR